MPEQLQNQNPEMLPKREEKATFIKPSVRTMKSDVEVLLQTTKPSFTELVGMEIKQNKTNQTKEGGFKKNHLIAGLILLILLSGAGIFLLASGKKTSTEIPKLVPPAPIFAVETSRTVNIKMQDRTQFLRLMRDAFAEPDREGTIKRILIKVQDGPQERFVTPADFFTLYRITPPKKFFDYLNQQLMVFIYNKRGGNRIGIAIPTRSADRTLHTLLSWEPSLLRDLEPLFFGEKGEEVIAPFEDRTYRNVDWRYLKLSATRDLGIGYTIFPVGNILILTTGKEIMEMTINRLFEAQ